MSIILSAQVGHNAELFSKILELYAKSGDTIADVTFGKGNFWKKIDIQSFKLLATDLSTGTDFRALPYENQSIDILILDPPYIYNPKATVKASVSSTYRINETPNLKTTKDIINLYLDGAREALRVLKKKGYLIIKCQDQIESGKQQWVHIELKNKLTDFYLKDLLVLVQKTQPAIRWKHQKHARKNHSYFLVFQKM